MDKLDAQRRSENMRRIRSKNTKPELLLRSFLHQQGYRFRVHRKDLPGTPDIVFPGGARQFSCMAVSGISTELAAKVVFPAPGRIIGGQS